MECSLPGRAVLSCEEERELLRKARAGDASAREELVNANLKLVASVVQRFLGKGAAEFDDLFQVGCIGLIKAVDRFDPGYNVRFSTYAVPLIIGEIRRHLREDTTLKVSRTLKDVALKALRKRGELAIVLGRDPSIDELASEVGASREELVLALEAFQQPVSLFEPIYHDGGDPIYVMDQTGDEKNQDSNWLEVIAIRDALRRLSEREKLILTMRFFEGKTQMGLAEEIGISQAQVSRLEKAALNHMRKYL
uniref:SigB/SigF/SigG family RNA polymerase sigma factor n=1 Tax=Ammonifex degensii TaxID=42838 RepID=A0A7C1F382_9THEO